MERSDLEALSNSAPDAVADQEDLSVQKSDGFEGVTWPAFLAGCNAANNATDRLTCTVCQKQFNYPLESWGRNPWRLWQHLESFQSRSGHPSTNIVKRWDTSWHQWQQTEEQRALGTSPKPSLLKPKCKARFRQLYRTGVTDSTQQDEPAQETNPTPARSEQPSTALPPLANPGRVRYAQAMLEGATAKASLIIDEVEIVFASTHDGMSSAEMEETHDSLCALLRQVHETVADLSCKAGQMMMSFPWRAEHMVELVRNLDSVARAIVIKLEQITIWTARAKRRATIQSLD